MVIGEQLPLPHVRLRDEASFDSYYAGSNGQIVQALRAFALGQGESLVYLWGAEGSGRTHLLEASLNAAEAVVRRSCYLSFRGQGLHPQMLEGVEAYDLVCWDDIDAIAGDSVWEEAVFAAFNTLREAGVFLLITATAPPAQLAMHLPDLRSRLGWGLVYHLSPLNDEDKLAALQQRAQVRGLTLPTVAGQFLLRHCPRDMAGLFQILDILDKASLSAQRRLTVPFIKTVLAL